MFAFDTSFPLTLSSRSSHHAYESLEAKTFPLLFPVVLGLAPGIGLTPSAWSQAATGGSLRGVVTDATGALLKGATLKLTSPGTQAVRTQVANGAGQYSFVNIEPGLYTLEIAATGFQSTQYEKVTVILNETRELNVALAAGGDNQTVEVRGDQASIVTLETQVGSIIDEQQIKELPLNGRDFQNLVFLAPGASRTASGTGQGSGVSAGGARPTDNNYLIDGGDANDPRVPSGSAATPEAPSAPSRLTPSRSSASSPVTPPRSSAAALVA